MASKTQARKLGRPRDTASEDTRARLLAAARRCFGANGFDRTTNAQIAEVAGLTSAAIYHYFPSKIDLYAAVFEEVQNFIYSQIDEGLEPHENLVDRFAAALDVSVRINRDDPTIAGFVVDVAYEVQHHPELDEVVRPQRERAAGLAKRLCDDAYARGEIRDGIPQGALEDLLSVLLSGLLRFSTLVNNSPRHAAAVEVLKGMLRSSDTCSPAVLASGARPGRA